MLSRPSELIPQQLLHLSFAKPNLTCKDQMVQMLKSGTSSSSCAASTCYVQSLGMARRQRVTIDMLVKIIVVLRSCCRCV